MQGKKSCSPSTPSLQASHLPSILKPGSYVPSLHLCSGLGERAQGLHSPNQPARASSQPRPLPQTRQKKGREGVGKASAWRGPGTEHLRAPPCKYLHHWHFLVNLGQYSTSLSLTASLYPQRKLKIADQFLHLHQPLKPPPPFFIFQFDCRRR